MIVSKVTYIILIMLQVLVLVERLCLEIWMDLFVGTIVKVITQLITFALDEDATDGNKIFRMAAVP